MVSTKGGKFGYVCKSRHDVYKKLRKKGMAKTKAAAIANGGCTKKGRSSMAKKAARTRKKKK